ncbi:AcrR family transcriptional regulator [Bradyrhizobium sp. AZCC 2262]
MSRLISVSDVMKRAGLTHGGFYAYFESREAVMIEAFTTAMRCCERVRFIAQ